MLKSERFGRQKRHLIAQHFTTGVGSVISFTEFKEGILHVP